MPEDVRTDLGDRVEVGRRRVHVAAGEVVATERAEDARVTVKEGTALLPFRKPGHGQHGLATAEGQAGDCELGGHPGREPRAVAERFGRPGVDLHARAAGGGA